jgi:spermidine dehydrogenase
MPDDTARTPRTDDRRLGMDCPIERRDFLNGVLLGAGTLAAGAMATGAAGSSRAPLRQP